MSSEDDTPTSPATPVPEATRPAASSVAPVAPSARSATDTVLEQFAHEYIRERRNARRWSLTLRLGWLLLFALVAWGLLTQNNHASAPNGPHTALVELRGEIAVDTEASADVLLSGLRSAFEDSGAQAVVIRINSPGGSPVQAGIIHDEILRLKAKHDKEVYAVVEESCASGAYYVAVAADSIYVDKASIVGSIGVLMDGFGFTSLMEKLGVERRMITAGSNKGMLDPFSPLSESQRAFAQSMLDQIHQQFIKVVKDGRGERLKETPETFSGLFWSGEEAVRQGLADGFGNLEFVAREIVKAEEVIDYTPHENVAERLAKRFGAAVGEGAVKALRNLPQLH